MEPTIYQTWWKLHVRVARGETLNPQEQEAYEEGLKQLDAEENIDHNIDALRKMRESLSELETERVQMQERHAELAAKIAVLEASLSERTRQLLGIGG